MTKKDHSQNITLSTVVPAVSKVYGGYVFAANQVEQFQQSWLPASSHCFNVTEDMHSKVVQQAK
jgi:hypothetical protein